MSNIQVSIMYFINNGLQNPFLDWIVPIIYSFADVRVMLTLMILVFISSRILMKEKINKIAMFCIIAFCLASVFILLSKIFYPSTRPFVAFEWIRLTVNDNGFYSFPSGHFAIATMILSIILMNVDKYKKELFALSILYLLTLAFVVIYGGVHYPIDVLGGFIIGVLSAIITVRYLGFLTEYLDNFLTKYFDKYF